ncbi:MAG TPA: hypothetical protein VJM46_03405 [Candidatus Saccharimonadales bacterium]|nr:hypothetical protein [Candidatus Saccharimonadales bacterium]
MTKVTGCGKLAPERNEFDSLPAVGDFRLPPTLDPDALDLGASVVRQLRKHGLAIVGFRPGAEQAIIDEAFQATAELFTEHMPTDQAGMRYSAGDNGGYRARKVQANEEQQDLNRTFNIGPAGTFIPHRNEIEGSVVRLERARNVIVRKLEQVLYALPLSHRPPLDEGTVLSVNFYDQPGQWQQGTHCDGVPLTGLVINRLGLQVRCQDGYRRVAPDTKRLVIMSSGILQGMGEPTVHRVVVENPKDLEGRISLVCFGTFPPDHPATALIDPALPEAIRDSEEDFALRDPNDPQAPSFYAFPLESDHWNERDNPKISSDEHAVRI